MGSWQIASAIVAPPAAEEASEADAALALLHNVVGRGFRNLSTIRAEDGPDPLRGRDDFKLLTMDVAIPDEPFAAAR